MDIARATSSYEAWLAGRLPLIEGDLREKHRLMKQTPFAFFRGTFYRWAQSFPTTCQRLMHAPTVLAVGDLHVSNFGTWRDSAGHLVWGINDFDEACRIPYASDLVRLAVSAILASREAQTKISPESICSGLLDGYERGMLSRGNPFLLGLGGEQVPKLVERHLKSKKHFWAKLHHLPPVTEAVPQQVLRALRQALPQKGMDFRVVHRISGLGSLGRRRFTALAHGDDGPLARESKELAPSAWVWANGGKEAIAVARLFKTAVRAADPHLRIGGGWVTRALGPDRSRIEWEELPNSEARLQLLLAMGWETANVHLGSGKRAQILSDSTLRRRNWLERAALEMTDAVVDDWRDWRQKKKAAGAGR